jgi:hypothetical protein
METDTRSSLEVDIREWRIDTNYGEKPMNQDALLRTYRLAAKVGVTRRQVLAAIKGAPLPTAV